MPISVFFSLSPIGGCNLFISACNPPALPTSPFCTFFISTSNSFPCCNEAQSPVSGSHTWCPSAAYAPSSVTNVSVPMPPTSSFRKSPSLFSPDAASFAGRAFMSNVLFSRSTVSVTPPSDSATRLRNSYRLPVSFPSRALTTSPTRRSAPASGAALPSSVATSPIPVTISPSALSVMPTGSPPT